MDLERAIIVLSFPYDALFGNLSMISYTKVDYSVNG